MKIVWWSILLMTISSGGILIAGLINADLTQMVTGAILAGLCVIAMRGVDGYINTGVWFG